MKVAIIHDDLMRRGGAEQVALALHKIFPHAPIYTLCYQPDLTYPEFKNADIRTSLFQYFVKNEKQMKLFFYPLGFWCMRLLKIKGYDKVILSSTYASKYARISKKIEVINYCHNPFRLAWYPETYPMYTNAVGFKKLILSVIIKRLKKIDFYYANKSTITIVNSNLVFERVINLYRFRPLKIIFPPVNLDNFSPSNEKRDYYLLVSRFEPYKKVDIVVEAFNKSGKKLLIVGNGSQKEKLKKMANSNIVFKENLSKEDLRETYAKSRAFIFPQEEDFGITPLEANASGIPVIAYGKGGVLDTMVPLEEINSTAIFFNHQTVESINDAVLLFEENEHVFSINTLVNNSKRFSFNKFKQNILEVIN